MTALCEAALIPQSTLDALEADVTTALDGWTHTAGELGNLRDDYSDLEDENRYLTLWQSVALQILSAEEIQAVMNPKQHAAFLRLRDGTSEELMTGGTPVRRFGH